MKTIKLDDGEYEVKTLRRSGGCWQSLLRDDCDEALILFKLPSNPMPELSVGDLYFFGTKCTNWFDDPIDRLRRHNGQITEIRFADGRIWRRG